MILLRLATLLAQLALASTAQVPYYLRELETQKDIGAVNENFRNLSDVLRKSQTDIETLESVGQQYAKLASTQSFTAPNTFTSSVIFTLPSSSETFVPIGAPDPLAVSPGNTFLVMATVTYTAQGSDVGYYYIGSASNRSANTAINVAVFIDGRIDPQYDWAGSTRAVTICNIASGASSQNCGFAPVRTTVSSGSHQYTLIMWSTDNTSIYAGCDTYDGAGNCNTSYLPRPKFGVKEWR